jgi:hypothetical protein
MYTVLLDEMAPISFLLNILAILGAIGSYGLLVFLLLISNLRAYQWGMFLAGGLVLVGLFIMEIGMLPTPVDHYFPVFLLPFLIGLLRLLSRAGKLPQP